MTELGTEKIMDETVSILGVGMTSGTSPLTASTWPCANNVTTQEWLA